MELSQTVTELLLALVSWHVGLMFGQWAEARKWREKAENGTRRASGGHLYRVELDD